MKECMICGTKADESANVCEVCGSSDFESEDKTQAVMQAEEEPVYSHDPDSVYRVRKGIDPNSKIQYKKAKAFKPKKPVEISVPGGGVVSGIFGAFLFSIAGGLLYVFINHLGYISGLCGLIIFILARAGFNRFSKPDKYDSAACFISSVIITVLMILFAELFSVSFAIYRIFRDEGVTLLDAVYFTPRFLENPEIHANVVSDLVLAYLFSFITFIIRIFYNSKRSRSEYEDAD
ncbi:MAG: hypothetical protein ACI4I3_10980 [Acutalibacteraceae bacterium]